MSWVRAERTMAGLGEWVLGMAVQEVIAHVRITAHTMIARVSSRDDMISRNIYRRIFTAGPGLAGVWRRI
jgi:hypothetical protein